MNYNELQWIPMIINNYLELLRICKHYLKFTWIHMICFTITTWVLRINLNYLETTNNTQFSSYECNRNERIRYWRSFQVYSSVQWVNHTRMGVRDNCVYQGSESVETRCCQVYAKGLSFSFLLCLCWMSKLKFDVHNKYDTVDTL